MVSALFSLYRNDLDPAHLEDILTITNEALTELLDEDGYLREAPANSRIAVGPTYSMSMVFGPSTWGSLYGPLERIAALTGDEQVRKTCETIRSQLVARAESQPMVHTDFLTSSLVPLTDTVVYLQGAPGGGGFDALHRLLQQPEHGAVTILHLSDDIPASMKPTSAPGPGATVLRGGKVLGTTGDPDELTRLLTKREE